MHAHLRPVFAARLLQVAQRFDSLAKQAARSRPATKVDEREFQAAIDAGAAIWEAVLLGLLNVPVVASIIGQLAAMGYREPLSMKEAQNCAKLFYDSMCNFIYPQFGGALSNYCFREIAWKGKGRAKARGEADWRRHELEEMATGCRILARLVETGADGEYRKPEELDAIRENLASELTQYYAFIGKHGRTGSEHEVNIFVLVYRLRCYHDGALPPSVARYWDALLTATTPHEEDPSAAREAALGILGWLAPNLCAELTRKRPAYVRDHLWLKWHMNEGLTPAAIRDRWNSMSDADRRAACATAFAKTGTGKSGRDVVMKGLKLAKSEHAS